MRHWSVRIFLLAFFSIWFGAIVPAHQRGVIALDPTKVDHCSSAKTPSCHGAQKHSQDPSKEAPPGRSSNCAICAFLATMDTPPAPVYVPRLAYLTSLETPLGVESFQQVFSPTYDGRGPPLS